MGKEEGNWGEGKNFLKTKKGAQGEKRWDTKTRPNKLQIKIGTCKELEAARN